MKKIFCDFRNQGHDHYCDILASESDIPNLISGAMNDYMKRLIDNGKELFSYSKIEKCNIFNLPISFDIETTNIAETKSALPYIWQIAIYETIFYGRFIDDFPKFINLLDCILSSVKTGKKKSKAQNAVIIYVHNLSFEFQFIRKLFQIIPDSFLNYDKRNIIKFEIYAISRIIFRCSYQLTRKPLRELSNSRNIIKLSPIDYALARTPLTPLTKQELDYALYDVYVMTLYFDDILIQESKNLSEVPYTLTGYARNYFKEKCGFRLTSKDIIPDNVREYRRILANCQLPTYTDLSLARHCFMGGFTHAAIGAYNNIHENVFHFDLSSSYPTVLLSELYPVSTFQIEFTKLDVLFAKNDNFINPLLRIPTHILHKERKMGYVMRVLLNNITLKHGKNECIISYSKIFNPESCENPAQIFRKINGRVHSGNNIQLFLTDIDFDLIKMFYDFDYKILNIYFAHFDYLPEVFCQTIADLYKDKTTLKGVSGKESDYALKKIVLNSIYGLCVTDPIPDDYQYNNQEQELQEKLYNDAEIQEKLNDYNMVRDKPNKINYYFWGVFCTAYARYNLITMIDKLGLDYLYADTDSVFFTGEKNLKYINTYNDEIVQKLLSNPHVCFEQIAPKDIKGREHILGQWTQEKFCNYFVTIGAKRYLEIYPCNYKFTCAGINPKKLHKFFKNKWREFFRANYHFTKLQDFRDFKYFEQRHLFIAELFNDVFNGTDYEIEDTGKITSIFNDEDTTGILTDYLGTKYEYNIKSSTYLENATFNLTMFDLRDTEVQLLDKYKIFKKWGVVDSELL